MTFLSIGLHVGMVTLELRIYWIQIQAILGRIRQFYKTFKTEIVYDDNALLHIADAYYSTWGPEVI